MIDFVMDDKYMNENMRRMKHEEELKRCMVIIWGN